MHWDLCSTKRILRIDPYLTGVPQSRHPVSCTLQDPRLLDLNVDVGNLSMIGGIYGCRHYDTSSVFARMGLDSCLSLIFSIFSQQRWSSSSVSSSRLYLRI